MISRSSISLNKYAHGHLIGARIAASSLREQVEVALAQGHEVVFDFSGVDATQSFIDELIGVLILGYGPEILDRLVFKSCSDNARAVIEFVAADRCDQYVRAHSH
ncbi:MAG: DUF4325 domain-containing protein [Ferrovum sp.]|jgi:hypothetical protein|nr:DUF4325 domain-containing protein [Ferrovum sp.]NDU89059.1 STAS-like domain-containing protein [Ferrovum sp.]